MIEKANCRIVKKPFVQIDEPVHPCTQGSSVIHAATFVQDLGVRDAVTSVPDICVDGDARLSRGRYTVTDGGVYKFSKRDCAHGANPKLVTYTYLRDVMFVHAPKMKRGMN